MRKVYIVMSKWANAEVLESNASVCGVFLNKEEAIKCYNQVIKEELDNGSLAESPDLEKEENDYKVEVDIIDINKDEITNDIEEDEDKIDAENIEYEIKFVARDYGHNKKTIYEYSIIVKTK